MKNPAMTAMVGPGYGLDNYTVGAMMAHQMLLFTAIAVGIMNIFLVVRHTRRDEESGRIEMIRALPVGRLANLSSTVLVSLIVNILLALIVGLGLYFLRIESMDLHGSLLYGAVLGDVDAFLASIDMFGEVFIIAEGFPMAEQFIATLMSIISIICTVPVLIFVYRKLVFSGIFLFYSISGRFNPGSRLDGQIIPFRPHSANTYRKYRLQQNFTINCYSNSFNNSWFCGLQPTRHKRLVNFLRNIVSLNFRLNSIPPIFFSFI